MMSRAVCTTLAAVLVTMHSIHYYLISLLEMANNSMIPVDTEKQNIIIAKLICSGLNLPCSETGNGAVLASKTTHCALISSL